MREAQITFAKCLAQQQPCTYMQVPFQKLRQPVPLLNGDTMSQACCASSVVSLSGLGRYLVRMATSVALSPASNLEKRSSGSLSCTSAEYFGGKASGIGRY